MVNSNPRLNALGIVTVVLCCATGAVAMLAALGNAIGWLDLRLEPAGVASKWLFVALLTVVSLVIAYFSTQVATRLDCSNERLVVTTLFKTVEIDRTDVENVVAEMTDGSWSAIVQYGGGRVMRVFPLRKGDLEKLLLFGRPRPSRGVAR